MQIRHLKMNIFTYDGHYTDQSLIHFCIQVMCIYLFLKYIKRFIKNIYQRRRKESFIKIEPMQRHVAKRNLNNLTSLLQIINTLQQELFSKYQSSFREICHFPAFIISPEQSEAMHQKYCRDHAGCNCSNALHIYV